MMNARLPGAGTLNTRDQSRGRLTAGRPTASSAAYNVAAGHFSVAERSSSADIERTQLPAAVLQGPKSSFFSVAQGGLNFNHDQKKRFFEICRQFCVNRKIRLANLQLGPRTAQELRAILEDGQQVSQLLLSKNCLGDEGAKILAPCLVGNPRNARRIRKSQEATPALTECNESRFFGQPDHKQGGAAQASGRGPD